MSKFLCKIDLRDREGDLFYRAGKTYTGKIEEGFLCLDVDDYDNEMADPIGKDSADGWFHAFELVKPEWPESINMGGAKMTHIDASIGPVVSVTSGYYIEEYARGMHEWLGKWLEAAESRAGE